MFHFVSVPNSTCILTGQKILHTSINKRKAIFSKGNEPSFTILLRFHHISK